MAASIDPCGLSDSEYLGEFYRNALQLQALDVATEERFQVEIDEEVVRAGNLVRPLINSIRRGGDRSVSLFCGGVGAGKSSVLLTGLRQAAERNGFGYLYVDIGPYHVPGTPVDPGVMLVMMAAAAVEALSLKPGTIDQRRPLRRLADLLGRFGIKDNEADLGLSPSSGIPGIAGLSVSLKLALAEDESARREVHDFLERNPKQFREELHEIFRAIFTEIPQAGAPVFVVDSIDHIRGRRDNWLEVRESLDALFSNPRVLLEIPQCHTVYCVSPYLQSQASDYAGRYDLLHIKTRELDGSAFRPGLDALHDVLAKRAPCGDVRRLLGDREERVLKSSGGNLRHLLHLICQIIDETGDGTPASSADIRRAERRMRETITAALSREHYEILREVRRLGLDGQHFRPTDDDAERTDQLEGCGALLRYTNADTFWYSVHPLIDPLL
jgi:hypothetical protein